MMNDWPYPFWIAHRGAGKLAPENTLAAFRTGASYGYRGFECDVKLSADGVPFLLHDATLDRTTPERGTASQRPWSELSRLDAGGWHSAAFAGEPVPSLDAIARYCGRNGFALNVEIKPSPGDDVQTGRMVAQSAARLLAQAPVQPLLSSFSHDALAAAQSAEPSLQRALLIDAWREGWLEEARHLGCVAVVANHRIVNDAAVARLHDAGMRVLTYTVNDPASAHGLIALGVDGIITDAVDRFSPDDRPTGTGATNG